MFAFEQGIFFVFRLHTRPRECWPVHGRTVDGREGPVDGLRQHRFTQQLPGIGVEAAGSREGLEHKHQGHGGLAGSHSEHKITNMWPPQSPWKRLQLTRLTDTP